MSSFDIFYNEDSLEPEAATGEYRYSIQADDINHAVELVERAEMHDISKHEVVTEYNFNRSTLTWPHKDGFDASLVIEPQGAE